MEAITIEEIKSLLFEYNIETKESPKTDDFDRKIEFRINEIDYSIIWFVNHSTLQIGNSNRLAQIPFRFMYFDNTFPLVGGNRSIAFCYDKFKKEFFSDREYPFASFRIPF